MKTKKKIFRMIFAAMCLALALILPFLTGQIQQIGNALCPMHIPVLLCGFICGPWYGLIIGAVAPLLRFLLFGMPPIFPIGFAMAFELAAYGTFSGMLYNLLPKKKIYIYISLISSMILGRIIWGMVMALISGFGMAEFGFKIFIVKAFIDAILGIVIQIVLIPILVMIMNKQIQKN